jgi:hypothetical protein
MAVEYRLMLTATFSVAADRDTAYTGLRSQLQTYITNNPGKIKKADMAKDDYFVAEVSLHDVLV